MMHNLIKMTVKGIAVYFSLIFIFMAVLTVNGQSKDVKPTDYIEVLGKVLSIDPIKGDISVRLEFYPHGNFAKEDLSLTRNIKFDTVSSNGKQEIIFDKGKRMSPTEVVINMYDGDVASYPFDHFKGNLVFFFTVKPDKPADKPKSTEESSETEIKTAPVEDETEIDVPFTLDFTPSAPGYNITSVKSKDSDESFVDVEMTIGRSVMVKFFSIFVMLLMWGISLAVLALVFTVVILGRKVEIAMFSFIATLIFAFVTVRNSQPAIPPIGIFTDYLSFFLAEVILALCLLTILMTWIFRPAAK